MTAEELLQRYQAGERDFRGVRLRGIFLRDECLRGIDLSCADLRGASLMGVNLSQSNLKRADFSGAFLILARVRESDLSQANFSSAFLIRTDLQHSCLEQANLTSANMLRANLEGVTGLHTALLTKTILQLALTQQSGFTPLAWNAKQPKQSLLMRLPKRHMQNQPILPIRPFTTSLPHSLFEWTKHVQKHLQQGTVRSLEGVKPSMRH